MFPMIEIPGTKTVKEFLGCACGGNWIPAKVKTMGDKLIVNLICDNCGTNLTYIVSTTDLDPKQPEEPSE